MTSIKSTALAVFVGAIAFSIACDAYAKRAGRDRRRGGWGLGRRVVAALDLTQEQTTRIRDLRERLTEDLAQVRSKLDELRGQLHALWKTNQPSKKQIMAKHAEMDQYRAQMREFRIQCRLDILNVLTEAQRAKLNELRLQRRDRRGAGGRGGWFGLDDGWRDDGLGRRRHRSRGRRCDAR